MDTRNLRRRAGVAAGLLVALALGGCDMGPAGADAIPAVEATPIAATPVPETVPAPDHATPDDASSDDTHVADGSRAPAAPPSGNPSADLGPGERSVTAAAPSASPPSP